MKTTVAMCKTKGDKLFRQELRQFGVGLGLLLTVVGIVLIWRGRLWGYGFFLLAPLLTLACRFAWPGVQPLFAGWMKMARFNQRVLTALFLTLLFFVVLTPTALLAKLCGQNFIDRVFRGRRESYWVTPRTDPSAKSAERQF